MFQMVGCLGCAACMVGIGFLDHRARDAAVLLLVLAVTLQNITTVAFRINALDIAPRYSSFILGLSSTAAVAVSLTAPLITSAVVTDNSHEQWQVMFYVIALLCLAGGLTFLCLGKAELQPWARADSHNRQSETADTKTQNKETTEDDMDGQDSLLIRNGRQAPVSILTPKTGGLTCKTENKNTTDFPAHLPVVVRSCPGITGLQAIREHHHSPQTHRLAVEKVFDLEAASQWSSSLSLTG
ncbi:vesicular glutamate transporter 1 [Plakobranchus ocellatus]|uniref:Vesicular glutamate transporter 1 n=1 Tax=Plakobranchus ocellatus TaxID=259542 RepID=A0AAV4CK19_9GAST|nr:vesicular glutamate transporter 1 [Plakobranchus ocellatus]